METNEIFAYIRISKDTSDIDNQRFQIDEYCKQIYGKLPDHYFEDVITGKAKANERELGKLLNKMKKNDLLIGVSTSRFGRNFFDVMLTGSILYDKGAALYTIQQNFDFSKRNPFAKVFLSIYAYMDEAERQSISDRTKAALDKKRAAGQKLGRPFGTTSSVLKEHQKEVLEYRKKGLSFTAIGKILGVTRQTVSAFLKAEK